MSGGRYFLDTNIFVYSLDRQNPSKAKIALSVIETHTFNRTGVVSFQVVQEFFNVALRKFKLPFDARQCELFLDGVCVPLLGVHSSVQLFERGLELMPKLRISWYDSLIVAAAAEAGCSVLYSEDLENGRRIGGLEIRNPFELKSSP